MRVVILSLFATVLLLTPLQSIASMIPSSNASLVAASYQDPAQPAKDFRVDINVNHGDRAAWYYSPMWIAIGTVVLILFIALIVMASRGGGTTIVKE